MEQITSGIAELDVILGGGFPRHSLNLVAGLPGTGKTILAQQFVFANARPEAPALYLTTLSEPAAKMMRYLQSFPFFDERKLLGAQPAIIYRDVAELVRDKGFQALPEILIALFNEHRPAYLVIDSFKALRDLGPVGPELRRALFDLAGSLAARACTSLIIGEYTAKEIEEFPEFAIADGIVCLVNKAYGTRDERYLRVLKLRGSDYRAGEHAFRITAHGLSVFPRLLTPREPPDYTSSSERISTGVPGLDLMFDGGLRRGSSTLVYGASGTGKTMLGLHFLFAGIAAGEDGLLVNFQENPSLLRHTIANLGWDVGALSDGLVSLYMSPVEINIDDVVQRIVALIETKPIRRVVIDSLGDLEMASSDAQRFRSYVYSLIQLLSVRGVTVYVTNVAPGDPEPSAVAPMSASYISDNVVALQYVVEGEVGTDRSIGRTLTIVKTRGSDHDPFIRRMTIGAHGAAVCQPKTR